MEDRKVSTTHMTLTCPDCGKTMQHKLDDLHPGLTRECEHCDRTITITRSHISEAVEQSREELDQLIRGLGSAGS